MIQRLRATCRDLLEAGKVDVIIGYGHKHPALPPYPVFITTPDDVDQLVWNARCVMNLTTYLTRKEVKALGRPGIIVKGCDAKALIVLEKESQIDRSQMVVIGMACQGVTGGEPSEGQDPRAATAAKCKVCDVHMPRHVDITLGETDSGPVTAAWRYSDLDAFMDQAPEERMSFWQDEFERCIKCYACRQACPLYYCEQCVVDKNRPTRVNTSASLKGNYAWHITRAFHLAGRCIGCDECTRACPAGIDLRLLNMSLARAAEDHFSYRPGYDPQADGVVGAFSEQDKESFIR